VNDLIPSRSAPNGGEALRTALAGATSLDVAVAFVTDSGVQILKDLLAELRELPTIRAVVRGAPISEPNAVIALEALGARVRVVMGRSAAQFHPKLWVAESSDSVRVLSGSGNLTAGGLRSNYEQFEMLHLSWSADAQRIRAHQKRWQAFFDLGWPLKEARTSPAWKEWVAQQSLREKLADELRALDRKLGAKRGPGATVRPGAVRRADRPSREDIAWLRDSLQQAVGERFPAEVSRPAWGPRAQVDIGDDRALRYVFLMPGDDLADDGSPVAIELRIHAGDTLSQARCFYAQLDDRLRRDLVDLGRRPGWSVRPDFHFGFRARGFLHDHGLVDVSDYIEYWRQYIGEQRERPAGAWPRVLRGLADEGVVSSWYPVSSRKRSEPGRLCIPARAC
jgi:hypothetical protein